MKESLVKIKFGVISQEDARELERQQAEQLRREFKKLSTSYEDKKRAVQIEERLKAIKRLSESKA